MFEHRIDRRQVCRPSDVLGSDGPDGCEEELGVTVIQWWFRLRATAWWMSGCPTIV